MTNFSTTKLAIIGAGLVGSTFAYTALIKKLASKIILIDVDEAREAGEVMDLSAGLAGTDVGSIQGGDLKDCADVDMIVITAGAAQKPGQTRLDLVKTNAGILRSIITKLPKLRPDTIVLIVSNPVDILTTLAKKWIKLPASQIFGSGTSLDTARLHFYLSQLLKINIHNVHGYVLGEHGDLSFVAWSSVNVGTKPIINLLNKKELELIEQHVKKAAYEIIQRKHATYYGIAMVVAELVEAVLQDKKLIMPVATEPIEHYKIKGICLSVPAVLGRRGLERIWPIELTKAEMEKLKHSADELKKVLKKVI
jgi:L-lactate dehydrogenase